MNKDSSHHKASGSMKSPNRMLAVVIVVLFVAVALVTVFSAKKSTLSLDPASPARTVQNYLSEVLRGNHAKAAEYIASESGCDVQDLDRVYVSDTTRVDLVKTEVDGENAQVWVRVDNPSGGPFETLTSDDHTYRLVRVNGKWLLTGIPWPLYDCGAITK